MPKPRKYAKPPRFVNRQLREIQAKPLQCTTQPQVQAKQNMLGSDECSDELGLIEKASTYPTTLKRVHMALPGVVHNGVAKNPLRYGLSPSGSWPFENKNSATSLPNQDFPTTFHSNTLFSTQSRDVGIEDVASTNPNGFQNQPLQVGVYAVGVEAEFGTQPICGSFNSRTDYSCIRARDAERLDNVIIRSTTPAQRKKWYSTPAGLIYAPQRYAVLDLKAFDPYIPTIRLTVLLLESNGPIDGVHIYLGRPVFAKVAEYGIRLSVREISGDSMTSGAMTSSIGLDGNLGMAHNRFLDAGNAWVPSMSDMTRSDAPSLTMNPQLLFSNFDPQGTLSTNTRLFSEASWQPVLAPTFDSVVDPGNAMVGFMKNPADDVFIGYTGAEFATHDAEFDSETIDPTLLSRLT